MSEHYYRVGDKRPEPGQWVSVRGQKPAAWQIGHVRPDGSVDLAFNHVVTLASTDEWFPTDPPPSELAPVEDQRVKRVARGVADYLETHRDYASMSKRQVAREAVRITLEDARHDTVLALGLVDQPTVEWVTDRLPNNDEYPVLFHMHATGEDEWGYLTYDGPLDDGPDDTVTAEQVAGKDGWRWVPLRSLLDAAGLGER